MTRLRTAQQASASRWDVYFLVIAILILSGTPQAFVPHSSAVPDPAYTLFVRCLLAAVFVGASLQLFRARRAVLPLLKWQWPLLCLLAVSLASAVWSVAPETTIRRAIGLIGTTAFGLYAAAYFRVERLLALTALALALVLTLNLVFMTTNPVLGVSQVKPGAWQGFYTNSNTLARYCALAGVISLLLIGRRGLTRMLVPATMFVGSTAMLAKSQSATGLVVLGTLAVVVLLGGVVRLRSREFVAAAIVLSAVVAPLAVLAIGNYDSVLMLLGRDSTLTGRTIIWSQVFDLGLSRPKLGFGFGTARVGGTAVVGPLEMISSSLVSTHNGFLELFIELGWLGLLLFCLAFIRGVFGSWHFARAVRSRVSFWPAVILAFTLLYNLTESNLVAQNSLYWALFVAALLTVHSFRKIESRLAARRST